MGSVEDRPRRSPRAKAAEKPSRARAAEAHRIRIVGGRWKRTPLPVPAVAGLRPTPDRVRETLFNWLGASINDAVVLDLFAGTGALGLEAASRGAARVTLVESDAIAWRAMRAVRDRLGADQLEIVRDDAQRWLAAATRAGRRFDLVLLDPPFGQGWIPRLLPLVAALLTRDGRVYVESESALDPGAPAMAPPGVAASGADPSDRAEWQVVRAGRAGQVHYHLLQSGRLTVA